MNNVEKEIIEHKKQIQHAMKTKCCLIKVSTLVSMKNSETISDTEFEAFKQFNQEKNYWTINFGSNDAFYDEYTIAFRSAYTGKLIQKSINTNNVDTLHKILTEMLHEEEKATFV